MVGWFERHNMGENHRGSEDQTQDVLLMNIRYKLAAQITKLNSRRPSRRRRPRHSCGSG